MTDRYACFVINSIWSLPEQLRRWERVERTVSEVIGHPLQSRPLPWTELDVQSFQKIEAQYGHDLAAFVEMLRTHEQAVGSADAARWLHYSLCSSDVVDAGWLLGIQTATDSLWALVGTAVSAVGESGTERDAATLYRTHGQAAQVGPASARWAGHWRALRQAGQAMQDSMPDVAGFDGPTGNGGMLDQHQRFGISQILRLTYTRHSGEGRQAADREPWVTWLQAVARIATVCERYATEIRLLAHAGVDEVREGRPDTYRGSSSMPQKINPSRSERICGLAPIVRALANGYAEAAASCWGSHSLEHSSAERIAIPQVTSLVGYILTEVADIARTLVVDADQVALNAATLHADSYLERNRLIESGVDGGAAWSQVRAWAREGEQVGALVHNPAWLMSNPGPYDGMRSTELWVNESAAFDLVEQRLRPNPTAVAVAGAHVGVGSPGEFPQGQVEDIRITATGTVTPNVYAADKHPELNNGANRDIEFDFDFR